LPGLAEHLGVSFGWRLEIVPGAGHVDQEVYDLAARMIVSSGAAR
jgi:hypothetical protein